MSGLQPYVPIKPSGFGDYYEVQTEAGCMIVCLRDSGGWRPWKMLLPHQLYVEKVPELTPTGEPVLEVMAVPDFPERRIHIAGVEDEPESSVTTKGRPRLARLFS